MELRRFTLALRLSCDTLMNENELALPKNLMNSSVLFHKHQGRRRARRSGKSARVACCSWRSSENSLLGIDGILLDRRSCKQYMRDKLQEQNISARVMEIKLLGHNK